MQENIVLREFDFLISKYNLNLQIYQFKNQVTVNMYCYYNSFGCFTVCDEIERDIEFYNSHSITDIYENIANVFDLEPQVWKKHHTKIGPFNNPFFWWNKEKIIIAVAEAIRTHIEKHNEFLGIKTG